MIDACELDSSLAISTPREQGGARWEVRPATPREIDLFLDRVGVPRDTPVTEAHVALIGNEIVACGLLRLGSDDRFYGHVNVAPDIPAGLGLKMLRVMRRVVRDFGEPVYTYPATHLYGERPLRLLAYLGFGEANNVDAAHVGLRGLAVLPGLL